MPSVVIASPNRTVSSAVRRAPAREAAELHARHARALRHRHGGQRWANPSSREHRVEERHPVTARGGGRERVTIAGPAASVVTPSTVKGEDAATPIQTPRATRRD